MIDRSHVQILVADDESGLRAGICEALRRDGYSVTGVSGGAEALAAARDTLFNLVITDVKMPPPSGVELARRVREQSPDTIFIVMTAFGTVEAAVEALHEGVFDYLTKPLDMKRLRLVVEKALAFQAVVAENNELRGRLRSERHPSPLIGTSEAMREVDRLISDVAATDVTVLIEGESGTGKELVARALHDRSDRRERPFVSVNCAALPDQLLEAELFGHVKGGFTGATANRDGRFQVAHTGTLFLDEIGDLSPKGQGDLLRVLEDGTCRRVGSSTLEKVDVRVIAATHRDLHEFVQRGEFREDLLYRLQVIPIVLPPLRERAEDIPLLLEHFLEHFCARHKRRRKRFDPEALRVCQNFNWPGNVRQMRNMVERVVITCPEREIRVEHLPQFLQDSATRRNSFTVRPGMSLAEVEKELIRQTLLHLTSNREEAARALGISRRSLQYKLKEYGLLDRPGKPCTPDD